ncbi:MAG TPA: acylphosphatase [Candidatus Binataceae bacterium]|nr:acylphosphatase [Candidatus Binataceae bacterium]
MSNGIGLARMRILVSGRVQGVCFRQATMDEAHGLGLTGWVRNRPDGRVEIEAEGKLANLNMLEAWAHRGPRMARVDQVETTLLEFRDEFRDFQIC